MTPKEKAKDLYDKMYGKTPVRDLIIQIEEDKQYAKQCAFIAVNEILNNDKVMPYIIISYWKEVKKEIKKL